MFTSFRHTVSLRCTCRRKLWDYATRLQMIAKLVTQILATTIRSKVLDFLSELIFDLILKFLELFKGFRLVLHQVNIPISTQVISKGHEVTKTIASGDVHGSTYIRVYDPQQVIRTLHYPIEWSPCHFAHEAWFTCIKGSKIQ